MCDRILLEGFTNNEFRKSISSSARDSGAIVSCINMKNSICNLTKPVDIDFVKNIDRIDNYIFHLKELGFLNYNDSDIRAYAKILVDNVDCNYFYDFKFLSSDLIFDFLDDDTALKLRGCRSFLREKCNETYKDIIDGKLLDKTYEDSLYSLLINNYDKYKNACDRIYAYLLNKDQNGQISPGELFFIIKYSHVLACKDLGVEPINVYICDIPNGGIYSNDSLACFTSNHEIKIFRSNITKNPKYGLTRGAFYVSAVAHETRHLKQRIEYENNNISMLAYNYSVNNLLREILSTPDFEEYSVNYHSNESEYDAVTYGFNFAIRTLRLNIKNYKLPLGAKEYLTERAKLDKLMATKKSNEACYSRDYLNMHYIVRHIILNHDTLKKYPIFNLFFTKDGHPRSIEEVILDEKIKKKHNVEYPDICNDYYKFQINILYDDATQFSHALDSYNDNDAAYILNKLIHIAIEEGGKIVKSWKYSDYIELATIPNAMRIKIFTNVENFIRENETRINHILAGNSKFINDFRANLNIFYSMIENNVLKENNVISIYKEKGRCINEKTRVKV
jgi:hypothetical protein